LEKQASGKPILTWERAGTVLGIIGASLLLNEFIKRMFEWADRKGVERAEPKYFNKMLEAHPQLLKEDPDEVMALWSTMYKNSPTLASDPIAAGAFVTQNIHARVRADFGGPTLDTYKSLVDIEAKSPSSDPSKRHYYSDRMASPILSNFAF
jgi:hypothetical protein